MTTRIKISHLFSENNMYRRYRKVVLKSKAYEKWIKDAGAELMIQRPKPLTGPYKLLIEAGKPDNRPRDVDNLLKPMSDLLVRHGIVRDDSDAVETTARWVDGVVGMVVTVEEVGVK